MTVTVRIHGREAVISNYHWRSEDRNLAQMLNALLDPDGPLARPVDMDLAAAQAAIEMLGGEIMDYDPPGEFPADLVI